MNFDFALFAYKQIMRNIYKYIEGSRVKCSIIFQPKIIVLLNFFHKLSKLILMTGYLFYPIVFNFNTKFLNLLRVGDFEINS